MENPSIKIESDGVKTEIYLDGKQIKGVKSVEFTQDVETCPLLKLEIMR